MRKILLLTAIGCLVLSIARTQGVAINSDGSAPDTSAMLDVKSSNKGVLIPRLALTGLHDSATIHFPKTSLLVYNTATAGGLTPGFYYWNVNTWTTFGSFNYVLQQNLNTNGHYLSGDGANNGILLDTNGIVVVKGAFGNGKDLTPQDSGATMLWYPKKAAFRAGYNTGPYEDAYLGVNSVGLGYEPYALGYSAVALGQSATAEGSGSVAIGTISIARSLNSVAIGYDCQTHAERSLAIGEQSYTSTTAIGAMAMGSATYVAGQYATAMGRLSQALGFTSTATGYNCSGNGDYSTAMGSNTTAGGAYTFAAGDSTLTHGIHSFALGNNDYTGGTYAFALGNNTSANGSNSFATGNVALAAQANSFAIGNRATAGSTNAFAIGNYTAANGSKSFATGNNSIAAGANAFSLGNYINANGANSFALGNYVTTNYAGSFILGDNSTTSLTTSSSINSMTMRFANGYQLFSNSAATVGVVLASGGNAWSTISDVRRKENFEPVDEEAFLQKLHSIPLTTWNYKGQDPASYRHYGPMAQDLYNAFGKDKYGTIGNDTTINQADFDGINFIGLQALEKRTSDLKAANTQLQEEIARLAAALQKEHALNETHDRDIQQLKEQLDTLTKLVTTLSAKQ